MSDDVRNAQVTRLIADARQGELKSIQVTLSGTPGTITTMSVPDSAVGFRLYPGAAVRFAINENPAAIATSSDATIATSALAVGGIARASEWAVRLLPPGATRTLRLYGAAGSEVVDVEFF